MSMIEEGTEAAAKLASKIQESGMRMLRIHKYAKTGGTWSG